MLWKIDLKKTEIATLNGHILKVRMNLETKRQLSEKSLIFLKTALFSAHPTQVVTRQGTPPPLTPSSATSGFQSWKG